MHESHRTRGETAPTPRQSPASFTVPKDSDQNYRSMTVSCTCLVCLSLTGGRIARPAFSKVFSRGRPWTSQSVSSGWWMVMNSQNLRIKQKKGRRDQ